MALDKAIAHGKEHRKQYRKSKAIDKSCRNHGGCPYCERNRRHKFCDKDVMEKGKRTIMNTLDDFIMNDSYDAWEEEYEEMMRMLEEENEECITTE